MDLTTGRVRRAAGALLLCAALAACDSGAASTDTATATPATPPPASGTPSPSPTGASSIPANALLQAADVNSAEPTPMEEGESAHVRPLRPCGDDPYPSDGTRTDAVAMRYFVEPGATEEAPTVLVEFVGLHEPGGAAAQFGDIGAALRRCPGGLGEGEHRWTVLDNGLAGDESMLVRIDQNVRYADEEPSTVSHYAALARAGDVIVVVTDLGWENTGGSEKLVRELIGTAVRRAGTIS
jgi:hypothetical protein